MTIEKVAFAFASEAEAEAASAALDELPAVQEWPRVVSQQADRWSLELYREAGGAGGNVDAIRSAFRQMGVEPLGEARFQAIPDQDWVTITQSSLPPVRAGRFFVHGSHDRAAARSHPHAIEIDAGRAFGTAHHASTLGCLIALDRLSKRRRFRSILDVGTGSGVLAIAAVKANRHYGKARAVDIDPVSVRVARLNARTNGVASTVHFAVDDGRTLFAHHPHDLVFANILAKPLLQLAVKLAAATQPRGHAILSGFTTAQAREIVAAYLSRGCRKVELLAIDGWTTAVLQRASRVASRS
jgi:ribosomal protein L11 methyltransferase